MLATAILGKLCAENVQRNHVLVGIIIGFIVKILKICLKDLAIQVQDVRQIADIMNIMNLQGLVPMLIFVKIMVLGGELLVVAEMVFVLRRAIVLVLVVR